MHRKRVGLIDCDTALASIILYLRRAASMITERGGKAHGSTTALSPAAPAQTSRPGRRAPRLRDLRPLLALALSVPVAANAQMLFGFGDSSLDTFRLCGNTNPYGTCSDGRGTMQWLPEYTKWRFDPATNYAEAGAGSGTFSAYQWFGNPAARGAGTQVSEFVARGGRIGARDLVIYSAGGNNSIQLPPLGPVLGGSRYDSALTPEALAARTLAETRDNVARLIGAGAREIVVFGGKSRDFGSDPASRFMTLFNDGTPAALAPLESSGTRIRMLDFYSLFYRAGADPAAYGLDGPFLSSDGRHPSELGHRLIARYASRLIGSADGVPAQTEATLSAAETLEETLADANRGQPGTAQSWRVFALPVGSWGQNDGWEGDGGRAIGYDIDLYGAIAGAGYRINSAVEIGFALGYADSDVDLDEDYGSHRVDTRSAHLWANAGRGPLQAEASLAWFGNEVDIRRTGVIDELDADTSGDGWQASVRVAWLGLGCGMQMGPILSARYTETGLDGYTESGDDLLAQRVGSQSLDALELAIGWRLQDELAWQHWQLEPELDLALGEDVLNDERSVRTASVYAPSLVATSVVDDRSDDDPFVSLAARLRLENESGLRLRTGVHARLAEDGGNRYGLTLGIEQAF